MRPQLDTHPGHNPKIVDAIVQEWCEEFGIKSLDDHIMPIRLTPTPTRY